MIRIIKSNKYCWLIALLFAFVIMGAFYSPATALGFDTDSGGANQGITEGELFEALSVDIQTNLPVSSGVYITGFCQDGSGNYYVMGTATGRIAGDDPTSNVSRIFVAKFDQELNEIATKVILLSQVENIYHNGNPATGYAFASSNSTYEIYNQSLYNGAMGVSPDGNVYIALRNKATKTLLYDVDELIYEFEDCICYMYCDDEDCDFGDTEDCPVCNAYRGFADNFVSGTSTDLILCKIDSNLNLQQQFIIGTDVRSSVSSNDSWARAYAIDFDSAGNIYVSGSTGGDILTDPVYGFNEFDSNQSNPYADLIYGRGFLVKVDPGMTSVLKSTYFAGPSAFNSSRSSNAAVTRVVVDGNNIYIAGQDCGGKLPNTEGAFSGWMKSSSSTSQGGFVAKLDKDTFAVERTTYVGGSSTDLVNNLIVDNNAVYIAGTTTSTDMVTHETAFRKTKSGSYQDIYLARLAKDLSANNYMATYYGSTSSRNDQFGLDIDSAGNIYITGETYGASSFPTTDGSNAGRIYISKLNPDLSANIVSTIIHTSATSSNTQGRGIRAMSDGSVVIVGQESATTAFIEKYSSGFGHSKILSVQNNPSFSSSNQYHGVGKELTINVNFSTYVAVTGMPMLELNAVNALGQNVEASYVSGSGSKQLTFTYTVQDGDTTNGSLLNCSGPDALKLNGGSILPAAGGSSAEVNLTTPTSSSDLPYAKIYISTVAAKVKNVTSTVADSTYSNGSVIPITVEFDGEIASVSGGTPTLELNSGGSAVFSSIYSANKKQLIFNYTVGATDSAEKLDYAAVDSLILGGAVIKDNFGNTAETVLPAPGGEGSLTGNKNIVIDSDVPYIISVSTDKEAGYYTVGAQIPIDVKFSKNIDKAGTIRLSLNTGSPLVHEEAVDNSDTLTFTYIVAGGQSANPLNFVSGARLTLDSGASITEHNSTKNASLSLPQLNQAGDLGTQGVIIDTTAPTCSSSLSVLKNTNDNVLSSSRYYKAGDRIGIRVPVNKVVTVDTDNYSSLPTVELDYKGSGSTNKFMTYDSSAPNGTTGTYLYFYYTVTEDDALTNGRLSMTVQANWKISFEPGQITDIAGNNLSPNLYMGTPSMGMYSVGSVYFDNVSPVLGSQTPLSATYNESLEKVDLSWQKPTDASSGLARVYLGRQDKGSADITALIDYAGSASTTTYADESIVAGKTYVYVLYAVDNAGNVSEYQYSAEVTIPGEPVAEEPYWAEGATLTVNRLSSTSAELSWNLAQAVDRSGAGIAAFKIYRQAGAVWEYLGETTDGSINNYSITGIDAGSSDYKVTILSVSDLESENAISGTVEEIYELLLIRDSSGMLLKEIYEIDLTDADLSNQHYSGTNNYGSTTWYGVTGFYVSDLIQMAGVSNYTKVTVYAGGSSPLIMSKDFIESGQYYYFGKDDITDKKSVKPMISLAYTEYEIDGSTEYQLPKFPGEDGVYYHGGTRLFFGQSAYLEINRPNFLKEVFALEVETIAGPISEKPTLNGVTAGTSTINVGDPIPAEFPEASALTATDATGATIDPANISRTVTLLDNPDHDPDVLSSAVAGVYTVTYRVVDTYGNETIVQRALIVQSAVSDILGDYRVTIFDSLDYEIIANTDIPQVVINAGPTVEIKCSIEVGIKEYAGSKYAVFVHFRGNKMISIMSIADDSFASGTDVMGEFSDVQSGDRVYIFVVDQLSGNAGDPANILFK